MTESGQAIKTPIKGRYSQLDLEERNEYLQEELKVCRKKMEELQADVTRLTSELRVAEKNELLASREAREVRNCLALSEAKVREHLGS
jgi:uncharacterized protein YydD (DUF2326 family)